MAYLFHTIGHGTRSIGEFVSLLHAVEVTLVVDIRTVPRSRGNPQYNADALPCSLEAAGIGYEHVAALGGLRGKQRGVEASVNAFWQNESFHNYADYAMSRSFRAGLARLMELGRVRRCAIMCAETVWWRCHRRIVADHLLARGVPVAHILSERPATPATLTPFAVVTRGRVHYPRRARTTKHDPYPGV